MYIISGMYFSLVREYRRDTIRTGSFEQDSLPISYVSKLSSVPVWTNELLNMASQFNLD